jgi:antitoxin HigA-1
MDNVDLNMTRMQNPPHPGEILREYLGDISVTQAAVKLGVNRQALYSLVAGASGVSADMAYRLADAFGTSPELWAGMQLQYDLYQAGKVKRPKIKKFATSQSIATCRKYTVLPARQEDITTKHVYKLMGQEGI